MTKRQKQTAAYRKKYPKAIKKRNRDYYKKYRESLGEKVRRNRYLRQYGITVGQYEAILELQRGVCAICGRPPKTRRLAVEHDHHTGRVRGLACHYCNRQVIGKNTVETARKLLAYLESEFDGRKIEEAKASPKVRRGRNKVQEVREEFLPAQDA